ncbi:MAG: 5'-3' exonuclease [Dermatophilus congolensis]|nr:5'-3' exonuclease [Dermatophilus congolensis]
MTGPLLLLDAASLYFRAFYGVPDRRSNPCEPPNNALRGFFDMISSLLTTYSPGGLVACWDDDWRPAFRVAAIASYKAHRVVVGPDGVEREDTPPALNEQVDVIADALRALGIARVGCPGYEADDVIGTLAHRWAGSPEKPMPPIHIVTGDRDLFQLVDDSRGIDVLYTAKQGVRGAELVNEKYLTDTYGVPGGPGYADFAILRGDPSDGLPGVKGVGEKTARTLLETYGDVTGIRAAAADATSKLTAAQRTKILDASDYLDLAPHVVLVARDAPVEQFSPLLPRGVADLPLLSKIAYEYRLGTTFDRLLNALGISERPDPEPEPYFTKDE